MELSLDAQEKMITLKKEVLAKFEGELKQTELIWEQTINYLKDQEEITRSSWIRKKHNLGESELETETSSLEIEFRSLLEKIADGQMIETTILPLGKSELNEDAKKPGMVFDLIVYDQQVSNPTETILEKKLEAPQTPEDVLHLMEEELTNAEEMIANAEEEAIANIKANETGEVEPEAIANAEEEAIANIKANGIGEVEPEAIANAKEEALDKVRWQIRRKALENAENLKQEKLDEIVGRYSDQ